MPPVLSPHSTIESESPIRAIDGNLKLQGWIAGVATYGVLVRLRLGETLIFECTAGISRPDVAATYPNLPGATNSGFALESLIPPGLHIGTLEFSCGGSNEWTPFHSLSITADLSPLYAHLESPAPDIDSCDPWFLHGWCFHPQYAIESLTIHFAHLSTTLRHGEQRSDVETAFPHHSNAKNSGFSGHLKLEAGSGPVYASARLASGDVVQTQLMPKLEISDKQLAHAREVVAFTRANRIKLPSVSAPEVSIIIPIYNQLELTLGCLESLVRHADATTFEVIIVDDSSEQLVRDALGRVSGLRLVSNEVNQGFVRSCNRGAQQAQGEYVLFLNNDTEVSSGWLEALHEIFDRYPAAGLVGAKLVYPDGRLQEAGGILWADGSAWNYGRNDDPLKPEYNYVRETDYCSGACIMLPRVLFLQLGGFDLRFAPAYCEDSDLAFQVRAAGYKVYYQPYAVITHFEGQSNGTDVGSGLKQYQVLNSRKLFEKWQHILEKEHRPNAVDVFRARERSIRRKVILFIDHYLPHYDRDAGSRTIWSYLDFFLAAGFSVKFIGHNYHPHEPYLTEMQKRGIEVLWGSWYACHWERWLERIGPQLDYVFFSRAHIAPYYLPSFRRNTKARLLFYGHDLLSRTLANEFAITHDPKLPPEIERWRGLEDSVFQAVDAVYYPSQEEIRYLMEIRPQVLARQLPPYVFSRPSAGNYSDTLARRSGIMFVGGFGHPPNEDAMLWFAKDIWPQVNSHIPEPHLTIAGSNPTPAINALKSTSITVTGFISDERLAELYASSLLIIVPLRHGGGIKGKVIEAMWHGVPVLTTPVGSEGIPAAETCMRIAAPEDFATALIELLSNTKERCRLATAGRIILSEHYSPKALKRVFSEHIDFN